VREEEQAVRRRLATNPLDVAFDIEAAMSESVPWRVFHNKCGPEHDGNQYGFPVEQCQTETDLIDWMLHLNGKTWTEFTDWDNFVRKAVR